MNRIKELRQSCGIKQSELAERLKVSQAALSGYETGKYEADIETYIAMAEIFGVSLDYLLGGASGAGDAVKIPVLGSIPAGVPLEAIENITDWEELPRAMCTGGREYFGLVVKGDSMYPDYLDGDTVIVRRTPACDSGDVCVVMVDSSDATLKELRLAENGSVTLVPHNRMYPPRTYTREEVAELPVTIAGVVVELRRKIKK